MNAFLGLLSYMLIKSNTKGLLNIINNCSGKAPLLYIYNIRGTNAFTVTLVNFQ